MMEAIDVLRAIDRALQDHTAAEVLDENSPLRDAIRATLTPEPAALPAEVVQAEPNRTLDTMCRLYSACKLLLARHPVRDLDEIFVEAERIIDQPEPLATPIAAQPAAAEPGDNDPDPAGDNPWLPDAPKGADKAMNDRLTKLLTADILALAAPAQAAAQPAAAEPMEVTEEMVTAYLTANDAYWKRTDELPARNPAKWRQGTPSEATRVSLRAALGAMRAVVHDKRCPAALNFSDPCNCGAAS